MQTMRRIDVQINGKLVGSCDSISKVSSPLFKDILDPWFDIKGFVPEKPSLNDNQQIVFEWLKEQYFQGYGPAIIITIHLLQKLNDIDVLGDEPVTKAYRALNTAGEAVVVKMFAAWALEQEEEE